MPAGFAALPELSAQWRVPPCARLENRLLRAIFPPTIKAFLQREQTDLLPGHPTAAVLCFGASVLCSATKGLLKATRKRPGCSLQTGLSIAFFFLSLPSSRRWQMYMLSPPLQTVLSFQCKINTNICHFKLHRNQIIRIRKWGTAGWTVESPPPRLSCAHPHSEGYSRCALTSGSQRSSQGRLPVRTPAECHMPGTAQRGRQQQTSSRRAAQNSSCRKSWTDLVSSVAQVQGNRTAS